MARLDGIDAARPLSAIETARRMTDTKTLPSRMRVQAPATLLIVLAVLQFQAALAADASRTPLPADAFMGAVADLCGLAFAGRITANDPAAPGDPFAGKALVMHVRECGPAQVRIPFHVGEDRSRTWVLTRTDTGLRLKHDHRHADGSADVLTMYGGDTADPGSAARQQFPADAESRALFRREGLQASIDNTWAMEIQPGVRFVYELARPGRLFRVEFDLSQAVPAPPAPWGSVAEPAVPVARGEQTERSRQLLQEIEERMASGQGSSPEPASAD